MGKSYSLDLRERVIGFVASGGSRRQAASHFKVSPSFAVKLWPHRQKTGSPVPAKQGRPRGGGKLSNHRGFLIAQVEKRPDITMPRSRYGTAAYPPLAGMIGNWPHDRWRPQAAVLASKRSRLTKFLSCQGREGSIPAMPVFW
jgi:Transposase